VRVVCKTYPHRERGSCFTSTLLAKTAKLELRGFQKRHLLAHTMGVVDADYVARTGDQTAVVGRKIAIRDDDARAVMSAVRTMAQHLCNSLAK
jgi:hypothetical protein